MIDRSRIPKTFEANQVSLKLIMFHVYFLNLFRPINLDVNTALFEISKMIDNSYGKASCQIENEFQEHIKKIKNITNFDKFFSMISIPKPSNEYLLRWLRQSVINSHKKRYHFTIGKNKKKKSVVAKKKKPTLNTDDL